MTYQLKVYKKIDFNMHHHLTRYSLLNKKSTLSRRKIIHPFIIYCPIFSVFSVMHAGIDK